MSDRRWLRRERGRERWRQIRERRHGIFLLPSLLTVGNLFGGFYAIVSTLDGQYFQASIAVLLAMVMDILDGKVARLTRTTSPFGVELDSLADVVSFGVAPALMMYSWALSPLGRPGWLAAFLYLSCAAMRLARFNVASTDQVDRKWFVGLPSPAAAGMVAGTILLFHDAELPPWASVALALLMYFLAFLMVSNLRYYSFKELDFAKRRPAGTLLLVILAVLIIASHPPVAIFLLFMSYLVSGLARRLFVRKKEATLAPEGTGKGETG